jgi:MATE family multidrug resistance protein
MAMTYMTACAAVFVIFREPLIGLFLGEEHASPQRIAHIVQIGSKILICTAVFQTADAFGIIYTGALRGAGDTVWPGIITAIYAWVFIIGGGVAFITLAPHLESLGPWIASAVYVILYGATMWLRFRSGRWRKIRLLEHGPAAAGEPATMAETAAAPARDAQELSQQVAKVADESLQRAPHPQSG